MTTLTQHEVLRRLGPLCDLAPSVRFGQLMAHLGFLAEDMFGRGLWDIDDEDLLQVIDRHAAEMAQRAKNVA